MLKEIIHWPTVDDPDFLHPRKEFPPQRQNFVTGEEKMRGRLKLAMAEWAEVTVSLNLSPR